MKTTQIENYISDVKENAKKTIATVVAIATIGTGALALASCDETPSVSANEVTTTNDVTNELPSEELTNDFTTEEGTTEEASEEKTTDEGTTEGKIIEDYESELISLLSNEYPEYLNGIFGFNVIINNYGFANETYSIKALCFDEEGNMGRTLLPPTRISTDTYNEIRETLGENFVELYEGQCLITCSNLSPELSDYIFSTYYDIYINNLNPELID